MAIITQTTKLDSVLTNVTSCILSDITGTAGIKRNDTGQILVAAGTSFATASTGVYTYDFTAELESIFYTANVKIVASGHTIYREVVFFVNGGVVTEIVPSTIMAKYIINELALMVAPGGGAWPLYKTRLPETIVNAGAIFDTTPYAQGKNMQSVFDQRYGIQLMLRSEVHADGYQKSHSILEALQTVSNAIVTIGGISFRIENISTTSGVVSLGVEENTKKRYLFTLNLLATIKEQ